jgi:AFG3 family protein
LEREVLFQSDVETLIGKRPFEQKKILEETAPETTSVVEEPAPSNSDTESTPGTEA